MRREDTHLDLAKSCIELSLLDAIAKVKTSMSIGNFRPSKDKARLLYVWHSLRPEIDSTHRQPYVTVMKFSKSFEDHTWHRPNTERHINWFVRIPLGLPQGIKGLRHSHFLMGVCVPCVKCVA
ncbi:hypothetical protein RRG08_064387 [Elysia crispata]|uniref:Uncharacterized protein n=1 Tax=Elysia crispata TaxID=231223 RepID=A0AAE0YHF4_9GAST|nr:hypothetical protein RRG08_064387 [Elysia crispata]